MTAASATTPVLTTRRLVLTGHRADDLDDLAAMWADPAVYALLGAQPRSREDVWMRLLRSVGQWTLLGYGFWVVRDGATGRAIGEAGLLEAQRAIDPPIDVPETGWALAAGAQGRGLAHEAMTAILAWSDARGVDRTACIIDPANAASIRLAGRLGYRPVAERSYHDRPIGLYERMAGARPIG